MGYHISSISEGYIYIEHDCRDELDGFIMMLKSIEGDIGGRIHQMDGNEVQYIISGDPFELVYKWDSQAGIAVVVNKMEYMDDVVNMLNNHFNKLNN